MTLFQTISPEVRQRYKRLFQKYVALLQRLTLMALHMVGATVDGEVSMVVKEGG